MNGLSSSLDPSRNHQEEEVVELQAALTRVLINALSPFIRVLEVVRDVKQVTGRNSASPKDLLCPQHLNDVVDDFLENHGPTKHTVIASIWSKPYFATVVPGYLIPTLVLGWDLCDALPDAEFVLDASGNPVSLRISSSNIRTQAPSKEPIQPLLSHLSRYIPLFSERSGVSEKVLWGNAGNVIEAFTKRLADAYSANSRVSAGCLELEQLMSIRSNGETHNPLFKPIVYRPNPDGSVRRQRRVCCMRYLVPDKVFCKNCPSPLIDRECAAL